MLSWGPQGSLFPRRALAFASHFLLREIELAGIRCCHVVVQADCDPKCVTIRLPVSKADPSAVGIERTLNCCCSVVDCADLCPACGAEAQLAFAKEFHGFASWKSGSLFHNEEGKSPPKWAVAADIVHAATAFGLPVLRENGTARFTGHAPRATGAIFYSLGGIELAIIQLFGRWGSDAFRLYVLEAPLLRARDIAAVAHAVQASGTLEAVEAAPPMVLPPIPVQQRGVRVNRLPMNGDQMVRNSVAHGSSVARAEGRLHAILLRAPEFTVCGWPHSQSLHAVFTSTCDVGVVCGTCYNIRGHASATASSSGSSCS